MKKQVCEGIYWVGANEWSKSHFHGTNFQSSTELPTTHFL
jgi:hypothetical protein